jgi:hypothetical protein
MTYRKHLETTVWKVSAQKTDLHKRNDFLTACTHQKCTQNVHFSEVNLRHSVVLKASQKMNNVIEEGDFRVVF